MGERVEHPAGAGRHHGELRLGRHAANLRGLGYDVVNTAYNTGSYTRFFLIPAAFGDSRHVPKGTIYAWTPATPGGRNLGQQVAVWADQIYFGDTKYFTDELDPRRAELAERTWNSSATTATYAQFTAKVAQVGAAPGVSTTPRPGPRRASRTTTTTSTRRTRRPRRRTSRPGTRTRPPATASAACTRARTPPRRPRSRRPATGAAARGSPRARTTS
ncbi:hypothetical protein ACFQV2_21525 [Actinokineospora soli]|uniref:Uncharacterized protein n=1 Tax=Actinokineospora soli TaxID=1048753 RepID=A0ABW2TQB7_9PSEU